MTTELTFGHWLRRRRKALDLTQAELARRVGCAKVTLQKVELEERRPSREIVVRLMEILDVAPDERSVVMRAARGSLADDALPTPDRMGASTTQRAASSNGAQASSKIVQIPAPTTPLVGRDHEVAFAHALLRQPTPRLITFTGTGGTGKTRVAMEVARIAVADFRDGVVFVALGAITDPALVGTAIGKAVGLTEHGSQSIEVMLRSFFQDKQFLLVLDTFEQILEAAPLIAELLAAAPQLKTLVTSRAPLHLTGEQEYPVLPLRLPNIQQVSLAEELMQYSAVELFVQRVQDVRPDFQLTGANGRTVGEICVQLDGLPLAIELVVMRTKMLGLETLLARLQDRLSLLIGGARDLPARQRSLRAAIDWTYDLLTPHQQHLWQRLAVFSGGITLEAAEALDGTVQSGDLLDALQGLIENGVLRAELDNDRSQRYRMLETIREYGRQQLEASGRVATAREQHAQYFLRLAEQIAPALEGGVGERAAYKQLEQEYDNLRTALQWYMSANPAATVRLVAALGTFWMMAGYFREAQVWLERALAVARATPIVAYARVLWSAGWIALQSGNAERAARMYQESLALVRPTNNPFLIGRSLLGIGQVALEQGDAQRARPWIEQGLPLLREAQDGWGISVALQLLGTSLMHQGEYVQARRVLEEALAISREATTTPGTMLVLYYLAGLGLLNKDEHEAHQHAEESYMLAVQHDLMMLTSHASEMLARVLLVRGEVARARELLFSSLTMLRDTGSGVCVSHALEGFARLALANGDAQRSAVLLSTSDAHARALKQSIMPIELALYKETLEDTRAALTENEFHTMWEAGQAMPIEDAIALAFTDTRVLSP